MDIPLPQSNTDIYSYGFDKTLSRNSEEPSTGPVYNTVNDQTNTSQLMTGGDIVVVTGTGNSLIVVDPTKGLWIGNSKFTLAPFSVSMNGDVTASSITLAGVLLSSKGTFGGDGSDGALSISSGTTTINCSNAAVVVKQYTSISITGTGALAFSNPNANGTLIVLKSQGAVDITSSATSVIDVSAMGASAGTGGAGGGNPGTDGKAGIGDTFMAGAGLHGTASGGGGNVGGAGGAAQVGYTLTLLKSVLMVIGGGGGGGGSGSGTGGNGGRGGGALYIECAGALNYTGTIKATGADATDGTANAAGGGGGGGGSVIILYKTLTANTGTTTVTGGSGGAHTGGTNNGGSGGGGGSASAGATASNDVANGGSGGNGFSLITQNTAFA